MKNTFYFSHDYNSRADEKIKRLIAKHGYLGYGIFWAIVEDLYNNANALRLDYECIAFDLRTDCDIIESIINDFDLFVINDDKFGSLSIQKRLEQRNEKSEKARQSANYRWNNINKNANAMRTQCECNAIKERKGKERKGKESKEKESKGINNIYINTNIEKLKFNFKKALIDYGFDPDLVEDWIAVRKTKKATNTKTAFNKFINEVEKSKKDKNKILRQCVENSWSGFNANWIIYPIESSIYKRVE